MLTRPTVRSWSCAAALLVLFAGSALALAAPPPADPMAPAAAAAAGAAPATVTPSAPPPAAPPAVVAPPPPAPEPPRAVAAEDPVPRSGMHRGRRHGHDPDFPFTEDETKRMVEGAIAIVVPVTLFLVIFSIVLVVQIISLRKERHKQETLRAMVEKGAAIPPELISPPVRRGSDLRKGLVLLLSGIGLALFLAILDEPGKAKGVWSLGLIPGLIGVGYLLSWRFEQRAGRDVESK